MRGGSGPEAYPGGIKKLVVWAYVKDLSTRRRSLSCCT